MYVLGRHQYVRWNPSINVAPAHSMNNSNTLALDRVPFIQRKSVNIKGLLHLYFQILIKIWKPFRRHTPAEVFPTTHTWQRGVCMKNLQNYKPIPLLLQTPYCLVDTPGTVTKQSWERNQVSNIAGKIEAHQNIRYSTHRTCLMGRPDTDSRRHHYSETLSDSNLIYADPGPNYPRGQGSITSQSILDFWWTKWHWDRFLRVLVFPVWVSFYLGDILIFHPYTTDRRYII